MRTAGIIAEYNPFHNGHKYQLEETRRMGATHIAVVMSGDSVQRGETAVFSKYERAKAALSNGADLIIELPCPYSCSNGEIFAKSAVQLLSGLGEGVINILSFGCESSSAAKLKKAADISMNLKNSSSVKKYLAYGLNYPSAVQKAVSEIFGGEESRIFSYPNNVLGIEYIKALDLYAPWIEPMPVKRMAVGHDSNVKLDCFASATEIRRMIRNGEEYSKFVPFNFSVDFSLPEKMDIALLYKIITASKEDVLNLPDVNADIANRFISAVNHCPSTVYEFADRLKTKNITMARIRRLMLHLMLGVKSEDILPVPYGRILGLNNRGREILALSKSRSTLVYDTSLKNLENSGKGAERVSFLEQNAVRFREMCSSAVLSNEYKRKITIM